MHDCAGGADRREISARGPSPGGLTGLKSFRFTPSSPALPGPFTGSGRRLVILAVMQLPASGEGSLARINLMYVGPLDEDHHVDALVDAFLTAYANDPRLHLLVAGDGPAGPRLRRTLGTRATFVGFSGPSVVEELAAEADLLICPTTCEDTRETIATAQRNGLPVLAVDGGEAAGLIENGRSGFLVPDDSATFVDAIRWLSRRSTLRERLSVGGRVAAEVRQSSEVGRIMEA